MKPLDDMLHDVRNAYLSAANAKEARVLVHGIVHGAQADKLPPDHFIRLMWFISGFEEATFALRGWRDNDRQYRRMT